MPGSGSRSDFEIVRYTVRYDSYLVFSLDVACSLTKYLIVILYDYENSGLTATQTDSVKWVKTERKKRKKREKRVPTNGRGNTDYSTIGRLCILYCTVLSCMQYIRMAKAKAVTCKAKLLLWLLISGNDTRFFIYAITLHRKR